jgi:hypothetical protein
MTGLVGFRVTVRNMLPESLAEVYRRHGHTAQADQASAETREAARIGLALTRAVELPGVPGVGDQVWANPNWEPVQVIAVEWNLDPGVGEPPVVVTLDDLDEDEVGTEWGAIEVLLDGDWTPELDL